MTYIALLRAINVGGHSVKMDRLRQLFEELGFDQVRTFIQSGNVFFDASEMDTEKLRQQIEKQLLTGLGYEVPAILRTVEEFEQTLEHAPFREQTPAVDERFLVIFTNHALSVSGPVTSPKGDVEVLATYGHDAYIRWKIINGRPPSDARFLKDTLGTLGTARFYHTAHKILAAAKSA